MQVGSEEWKKSCITLLNFELDQIRSFISRVQFGDVRWMSDDAGFVEGSVFDTNTRSIRTFRVCFYRNPFPPNVFEARVQLHVMHDLSVERSCRALQIIIGS